MTEHTFGFRPDLEDKLLNKLDAIEMKDWIGGTAGTVFNEFYT